ncbi:MAG: DUF2141 domain-containing protein, partial [Flavobacteriales bacterium]
QYAVRVFQDENGNKKFDKNERYIPEEGWGYSNNVSGKMGPPDLKKQLINVNKDTAIHIKMKYYDK